MEEIEPTWFKKYSEQEQTNIVSFFMKCVQRLQNGGEGKIIIDDIYEAMEEKFNLKIVLLVIQINLVWLQVKLLSWKEGVVIQLIKVQIWK